MCFCALLITPHFAFWTFKAAFMEASVMLRMELCGVIKVYDSVEISQPSLAACCGLFINYSKYEEEVDLGNDG